MEQQLLQEQKKPNALAFQVAIIFAIYIILFTVVLRLMSINIQAENTPLSYKIIGGVLSWIPFIYAIYYVPNKHKQELGGFITYGRAFSAGFKTAAYSGLFIGIFMFLYYQFIDQAGMTEMVDTAIAKAKDDNQIKGIEMMRSYFTIITAFTSAIIYTISGLIISLIVAAVVKKERPLSYEDPQ